MHNNHYSEKINAPEEPPQRAAGREIHDSDTTRGCGEHHGNGDGGEQSNTSNDT